MPPGNTEKPPPGPPSPARPSASVFLLSPTNQILLLHRVQTSSSFPSAHVPPGGNVDPAQDGALPAADDAAALHADGPAYRLAALRETFEESGILLARRADSPREFLGPDPGEAEAARRAIHAGRLRFADWVAERGGVPDTAGLVPFTRFVTPASARTRFSTQMYLYVLPPSLPDADADGAGAGAGAGVVATHDGGHEHTAAAFDDAACWLARARAGRVILFPPQAYLLHLAAQFLTRPPALAVAAGWAMEEGRVRTAAHYAAQRAALLRFLERVPTAVGGEHATHRIPWADKVISPRVLFVRRGDGRVVLGLDQPGAELRGSGRGGDVDRVVLVRFLKEGPRDVEVRWRKDVVDEERQFQSEGKEKM